METTMYKSAVGIVTCNSSNYIQECIIHNHIVGFDRIIIMLDRCEDDTFERIKELPDSVRDKVDVFENEPHRKDIGFQHRAYQSIYNRYKNRVMWLAMFDDDEYFYNKERRKINELLADIPSDVGQIVLPWLKFNHNEQILSAPPDVTRLAYFTNREEHSQVECKSIIRLNQVIENNTSGGWYYCHSAEVFGKTITFDGKECQLYTNKCQMIPSHYDTCLVHYLTNSMEDYVLKYKKWKKEKDALNLPMVGDWFDIFLQSGHNIKDERMFIYLDELKYLLQQCKRP